MHPDLTLISTLAAGFGLSLVFGFIAARLGLPALLGYLLAGIAVGPFTPGFVSDLDLSKQLAEIGVMLLMFGVGLHFSVQDLLAVRRIAVPGALVQIVLATAMGIGLARFWGWSFGSGLVFGLSLSVASTVVLIKALESQGLLESVNGRIAVGWLVVEDLILVMVLVLLPPLSLLLGGSADPAHAAGDRHLGVTLLLTFGKVALFIALMLLFGRRLFPWLLWQVAKTGSRELFVLGIVATGIGVAYLSGLLFDVSFALGAFFAGMVLRGSSLSHRITEESLPLRDAFAVLFFVSVGMLFDPRLLLESPGKVLCVLGIIVLGKSLGALVIVLLFRYPARAALTISASLAQIGEFSFILAGLGLSLGLLPEKGYGLILAGSLLSIALNPLVFKAIAPLLSFLESRPSWRRLLQGGRDTLASLPAAVEPASLTGHTVILGYGQVGRRLAETLQQRESPLVVADTDREAIRDLRRLGIRAVAGDPSEAGVLVQAHVARARTLILAGPDLLQSRKIVHLARTLNPTLRIGAAVPGAEEGEFLRNEKVDRVFQAEDEMARGMADFVTEGEAGTPLPLK